MSVSDVLFDVRDHRCCPSSVDLPFPASHECRGGAQGRAWQRRFDALGRFLLHCCYREHIRSVCLWTEIVCKHGFVTSGLCRDGHQGVGLFQLEEEASNGVCCSPWGRVRCITGRFAHDSAP